MRKFALLLATLGLLAPAQQAQQGGRPTYTAAVNRLLAKHAGIKQGAWGAKVIDLATGRTIYDKDGDHLFTPASNVKLFATAYALEELGPDYRFVTRVVSAALPAEDGTLAGDLTVIGGGDPTIAGRLYPDEPSMEEASETTADALAPMDALVEQIAAAGVKRIRGDIIGDDSSYVWEPYPAGWAEDDTVESDGAPVSSLMFADNKVTVRVRPGEAEGEPARVTITPETGYLQLTSLVTTGTSTRLQRRREPGSRHIEIRGQVWRADAHELAVGDPAQYFAHVLRERLLEHGIAVDGEARAHHRYARQSLAAAEAPPHELARRESPPLANIVRYVNKNSQNLHAEVLLREAVREPGHAVTRAVALQGLDRFVAKHGISPTDMDLTDGSGLSRLDLATPDAVVKILRSMAGGENGELWMATLPIGGIDGTLKDRLGRLRGGKVMGKTGTLRHVTALSGYIERNNGKQRLAFSVMTNNVNLSNAGIRAFVDDLVALFVR